MLQAAIASLYAAAPSYEQTDWPQLVALYDELLRVWPSPVVALNRAVPLAMAGGPQAALAEVERLERDGRLAGYQYLPAVKADLLSQARPGRRGGRRLPAGTGPDRERSRARLPDGPPRGRCLSFAARSARHFQAYNGRIPMIAF